MELWEEYFRGLLKAGEIVGGDLGNGSGLTTLVRSRKLIV